MHHRVYRGGQALLQTNSGWKLEPVEIGVTLGKVSGISSNRLQGQEEISLKGWTILPGLIDSQVHFREPGLTHKEDIETGTRGAALGGITSVFEMPNTNPSTTTQESLQDKLARAQNRAWVDHAFYIGGSAENIPHLSHLEGLSGCCGIKIFMGSSTGTLLVEDDATLEQILKNGHRRLTVHCEDEQMLRAQRHIATESCDVKLHPSWRSVESCLRATTRLVTAARKLNRKVHVLHVTSSEEMDFLAKNKDIATVEVLPQHLTLVAPECYERLGTFAQQNPPIREKRHQDALWKAIHSRVVDVMGSDHAPHTIEEKLLTYPASPSGMPGVQTTVPLMLNHIHNQKISLERFVELMTPIQIFGIRNKGRIQLGADADFTIVDLKAQRTIQTSWIVSRCGWTPFDGMKVTGWPQMTVIRGHQVMREGALLGPPIGIPVEFT